MFNFLKKKPAALKKVRVRIAPSPTGAMHIGTARTALYNYLFAKQHKGDFILRIEDTDKARSEQRWTDEIIEQLKWLGITWDEGPDIGGKFGPYKDSQRVDITKKYLEQLLESDKAYYCFCTPEDLEAKRQDQMGRGLAPKYDGTCAHLSKAQVEQYTAAGKNSVIRFRVANKKVKFTDLIRGEVESDMSLLGDIVIAKNLEAPLFHFAVVVDDALMEISHVIRGEDHISNTPRQILLQEALGFPTPQYAHLPLLLGSDRSKMSKRQGDVAVSDYRAQGYLPEALINFVAFLGWNPGTEQEIFSLQQLVKEFNLEKVQKGGAVFNVQKLDSINAYYIKEIPLKIITELCLPYLHDAGLLIKGQQSEHALEKIVDISRPRMKKLSDIIGLSDFFFRHEINTDLLKWKEMGEGDIKEALETAAQVITETKKFDLKNLEQNLFAAAEEFNKKKGYPEKNRGYLLWPLRVALSGKEFSPSPFEIAEILGKEKTLERIQAVIDKLS